MSNDVPLAAGDDSFANHTFTALGVEPLVHRDRLGGSVMIVEKHPPSGPITLMTAGVSRLPLEAGRPCELAVEVVDGQQGAGVVALHRLCDMIAVNRLPPPPGVVMHSPGPFLDGTDISAMVVGRSSWGQAIDEVRDDRGNIVGDVWTIRLLTSGEAQLADEQGYAAVERAAGGPAGLLDVTRARAGAIAHQSDVLFSKPIVVSKLHEQNPPAWVTLEDDGMLTSVTGLEDEAYVADPDNFEVWDVASFVARFPWTEGFLGVARPGDTARFVGDDGIDTSGNYVLES